MAETEQDSEGNRSQLEQEKLRGERFELMDELERMNSQLPSGTNFIAARGFMADDNGQKSTTDGRTITITGKVSVGEEPRSSRYAHNFIVINSDVPYVEQFTLVTNSPDNPFSGLQEGCRTVQSSDKIIIFSPDGKTKMAESPIVNRFPMSQDSPLTSIINTAYEAARKRGEMGKANSGGLSGFIRRFTGKPPSKA